MSKTTISQEELEAIKRRLEHMRKALGMSNRQFAVVLTIAARSLCDDEGLTVEIRESEEAAGVLN